MRVVIGWIGVCAAAFVGVAARAEEPASSLKGVDPRVVPLAFMTGAWVSQPDESGQSEELWSTPMAGTIMGVFRWLKPTGAVSVFELLTITAEDDGVMLRLRHHNARSVAREDKDKPMVLRLESAEVGRATFRAVADAKDLDFMSYAANGPDRLAIEVAFKPESKRESLKFELTRRGASPGATSPGISADRARAIFDRLKRLEGDWRGKSTKGWTEAVSYKNIAAGSCIMEMSFDAHPNETMATMICLDNDRVLLTHYCVTKNQPRLVATEAADDLSTVTFTFLDGANLGPKGRDKGHMDKVVFRFVDDDRFTSRWTWYQDGKESWMEEIEHERKK